MLVRLITIGCLCLLPVACYDDDLTASPTARSHAAAEAPTMTDMADKIEKSESEWKQELTREEYHVLREKGTEQAFTGDLYKVKDPGTYVCAGCGQKLFSSDTKYESGSGWPSFYAPLKDEAVQTEQDTAHGMVRTEVVCSRCGGHLGHVFEDGPAPTGLRYCINSVSLDFEKKEGE